MYSQSIISLNGGDAMKIKWLILIAVLTGTIAFWGCGGSNATGPSPYATELEGTWLLDDSTYQLTFIFSDSNWTVQDGTYDWNGTFTLNTTVVPKHIDLLCTSTSHPDTTPIGTTSLGIYVLNTTATACTLAMGDFGDTVRPIDFSHDIMILDKQ